MQISLFNTNQPKCIFSKNRPCWGKTVLSGQWVLRGLESKTARVLRQQSVRRLGRAAVAGHLVDEFCLWRHVLRALELNPNPTPLYARAGGGSDQAAQRAPSSSMQKGHLVTPTTSIMTRNYHVTRFGGWLCQDPPHLYYVHVRQSFSVVLKIRKLLLQECDSV